MQGGQWKGRRRRKTRFRRFRWERLALAVACVGMIVFALVEIIGYGTSLTAYDGQPGGTQMTIRYARQLGIQVCCIKPVL